MLSDFSRNLIDRTHVMKTQIPVDLLSFRLERKKKIERNDKYILVLFFFCFCLVNIYVISKRKEKMNPEMHVALNKYNNRDKLFFFSRLLSSSL